MTSIFFKTLSFANMGFWTVTGTTIIGSNYYELNIVNFILGFIFFTIGFFWYIRYENFNLIIFEINNNNLQRSSIKKILQKTLDLEFILIIISLVISFILTTGVVSRVFIESKSVFG